MLRSGWASLILPVFAALALSGCGGGHDNPPPPPPAVTLTSIAVTPANSSVVAGMTVQLTATGTYSNGTTQNLTGSATWTSSAQGVASINSSGLATGTGPGSATITATSASVSGSTGLNMTAPMLSGTAAAGLPLVGTVTVKDALGATKTVTIGANGSYSVGVWGMTAPLVLRAEGNVGSTTYVIHSATAEIGAGGTVNITPLTDLIIANAAGQIAAAYFDSGDFAGLTRAELDAESAALKAKLLPVLQAMEVDASIDLLRTPFTPLASALDAALDVIRVSVDPATHMATIVNLVNQISITDDIAVAAANEPNPPTLSADGTATVADDLPLIRKAVTDFIALYETGLPQPASILALLSDDFLSDDTGPTDFANELANDTELVGGSFTDIQVVSIDYNHNNGANPLAVVGFTILDEDGIEQEHVKDFAVIRGTNGVWRLHGNQLALDIGGGVHLVNDIRSGCRASGFEFGISDDDTGNSAIIDHVIVRGPGLPAAGLRYNRNMQGGDWQLVNPGGNPFWYPLTDSCTTHWGAAGVPDATIEAIPDNATYAIKAYTGDIEVPLGVYGVGVDQIIPKRPLTLAELNASTRFPSFTTSVDLQGYNGGEITISAAGADPARDAWVYLGLTTSGLTDSIDADVTPAADGTFTRTFTLDNPGSVAAREVRVASDDEYDRGFMSTAYYRTAYTVGGTISGVTGGSVTLRLNGGSPITVSSSGPFTFPTTLEHGANYTVTVAVQPGNQQVCGPGAANGTGIINGANVTNVAILCANFSVAGTITGLAGSGLVLRITGTDYPVEAGSGFPASISLGGTNLYLVSIQQQPTDQTCTVIRAWGAVGAGAPNVTAANAPEVVCVDNATDPLSGTYQVKTVDGELVDVRAFMTFYPDGTYIFGLHQDQPDCGANNGNGVEYGVYNWEATDGAFELVTVALDTNGECGIDDPDPADLLSGTLTRDPGTGILTLTETAGVNEPQIITFAPVPSTPGTLIGSWGNNQVFDVYDGGTLFRADTRWYVQIPTQSAGIEDGCYLLSGTTASGSYTTDFSGTCTVLPTPVPGILQTGRDTNGTFGNSPFSRTDFTVTGDTAQVTGFFPAGGFVQYPITRIDGN